MNTIRIILVLFVLLLGHSNMAQETYVIKGIVKNEDGKLVKDARLNFLLNPAKQTRTNASGQFTIKISYSKPTELLITHVGYEQVKVLINKSLLNANKNKELFLEIELQYRTLEQVIVRGTRNPDTVFSSEITSVADYEFIGEHMVLLTYSKSLKKNAFLQLTSKRNRLISTYKTPKNPQRLFKDYENKLYLITKTKVYLIQIVKNEFRLSDIDKLKFNKFTTRIIDTVSQHFLYSDFNTNYPAFNYYSQFMYDSVSTPIHRVENSFMMELYRAEYKYAPQKQKLWAFRQELKTGVDKEIWIGATNFTQSLYFNIA